MFFSGRGASRIAIERAHCVVVLFLAWPGGVPPWPGGTPPEPVGVVVVGVVVVVVVVAVVLEVVLEVVLDDEVEGVLVLALELGVEVECGLDSVGEWVAGAEG